MVKIDQLSSEYFLEEVGSIIVDELSIGVEGSSVHIVTLINEISDLIVNSNKFIGRVGLFRHFKIINFFANDIQILFVLLEQRQYD